MKNTGKTFIQTLERHNQKSLEGRFAVCGSENAVKTDS